MIENPFIFNCWKHHRNFVRYQIKKFAGAGEKYFAQLKLELKQIGESQTDFYYGKLSTRQLVDQIRSFLKKEKRFGREEYIDWLLTDKSQYKIIQLSDGSAWTLRLGTTPRKYIHFHPGRHSPYTVRIKSSTLKSAITTIVWAKVFKISSKEISTVNLSRKYLLSLPPVKSFSVNKNILRTIELLEN